MRQTHGESVRLIAAELAQSVERLTAEREVASSIPGAGPLLKKMEYPNLFSAPPPPPPTFYFAPPPLVQIQLAITLTHKGGT